jgi:transcriptional regulator with XRE-family HTH domain
VENNIKQVSLQTITNICEVLGYSLEEFFALELTLDEKELLDNIKGLNEEQIKALNIIIKSMKK